MDYHVLCFLLEVRESRCNNLTFTLEVLSWHAPNYSTPKTFMNRAGDICRDYFSASGVTRVSDTLATSQLSGLINMISLIEWTSVMFCRMFGWFRLCRLYYDTG